jgi:hypothetical protein
MDINYKKKYFKYKEKYINLKMYGGVGSEKKVILDSISIIILDIKNIANELIVQIKIPRLKFDEYYRTIFTEYICKCIVKLYPENLFYNWYLLYDFNIIYKYYTDNAESRFRTNFLNYLLETISDSDIDNINNNIPICLTLIPNQINIDDDIKPYFGGIKHFLNKYFQKNDFFFDHENSRKEIPRILFNFDYRSNQLIIITWRLIIIQYHQWIYDQSKINRNILEYVQFYKPVTNIIHYMFKQFDSNESKIIIIRFIESCKLLCEPNSTYKKIQNIIGLVEKLLLLFNEKDIKIFENAFIAYPFIIDGVKEYNFMKDKNVIISAFFDKRLYFSQINYLTQATNILNIILEIYNNDREIILLIIKKLNFKSQLLFFLYSKKVFSEENYIIKISNPKNDKNVYTIDHPDYRNFKILYFKIPDIFFSDEEIVENLVYKDKDSFEFVSFELRNNEEFVIKCIKKNPLCIKFVSDELKSNRDFIMRTLIHHMDSKQFLEYLDEKLKDDYDLVLLVINNNPRDYIYASLRLRENKNIFEKTIFEMITYWNKNHGNEILDIPKENGEILEYQLSLTQFIIDLKYIEEYIPSKIKDKFLNIERDKIKWDFYILPLVKNYLSVQNQ